MSNTPAMIAIWPGLGRGRGGPVRSTVTRYGECGPVGLNFEAVLTLECTARFNPGLDAALVLRPVAAAQPHGWAGRPRAEVIVVYKPYDSSSNLTVRYVVVITRERGDSDGFASNET